MNDKKLWVNFVGICSLTDENYKGFNFYYFYNDLLCLYLISFFLFIFLFLGVSTYSYYLGSSKITWFWNLTILWCILPLLICKALLSKLSYESDNEILFTLWWNYLSFFKLDKDGWYKLFFLSSSWSFFFCSLKYAKAIDYLEGWLSTVVLKGFTIFLCFLRYCI